MNNYRFLKILSSNRGNSSHDDPFYNFIAIIIFILITMQAPYDTI